MAIEPIVLSAALDAFWDANKHIVSWTPDYKRKICVPPMRSQGSLLEPEAAK